MFTGLRRLNNNDFSKQRFEEQRLQLQNRCSEMESRGGLRGEGFEVTQTWWVLLVKQTDSDDDVKKHNISIVENINIYYFKHSSTDS